MSKRVCNTTEAILLPTGIKKTGLSEKQEAKLAKVIVLGMEVNMEPNHLEIQSSWSSYLAFFWQIVANSKITHGNRPVRLMAAHVLLGEGQEQERHHYFQRQAGMYRYCAADAFEFIVLCIKYTCHFVVCLLRESSKTKNPVQPHSAECNFFNRLKDLDDAHSAHSWWQQSCSTVGATAILGEWSLNQLHELLSLNNLMKEGVLSFWSVYLM